MRIDLNVKIVSVVATKTIVKHVYAKLVFFFLHHFSSFFIESLREKKNLITCIV